MEHLIANESPIFNINMYNTTIRVVYARLAAI